MADMLPQERRFPNADELKRRFVNRRSLFHQFMTMENGNQILAYWLCPAEPARSHFAALIADLAGRFDAPVFEPHLTIYVTNAERENPERVLDNVAPGLRQHQLAVRGLDHSDKFTKTLFVQFARTDELARLSESLRRASSLQNDYELNPHVSLIYKEMDEETKRRLAASITLPFAQVIFHTVKAVLSPAEIKSRQDVEAWRVVAERPLTE